MPWATMLVKVFPKKRGRWNTKPSLSRNIFMIAGDLERVVRRREDDPVRRHHLLDEHVPVVLQGTELLALLEAHLAASASPEPVVAQGDDLALDVAE